MITAGWGKHSHRPRLLSNDNLRYCFARNLSSTKLIDYTVFIYLSQDIHSNGGREGVALLGSPKQSQDNLPLDL